MSTQVEAAPTSVGDAVEMTAREAVNAALEDELASDPTVYMLGEDIASDGGVFKTNGGLPDKFPGRILNTPICENTFIGMAIGMSVTGLRPSSRSCSRTSSRPRPTRSSRSCRSSAS